MGSDSVFTTDFQEILEAEEDYLNDRREIYGLPGLDGDPKVWGLALSGGGVRSATFSLGVLQSLARNDLMKRFDYMSTVSGGGYIGSCLSSLLTAQEEAGLDNDHFPFTGLGDPELCRDSDKPELSVRHQIHHLRTHSEYLIPRRDVLGRDVQRAVGSTVSGMAHTVILFVLLFIAFVASVHLTFTALDPDLAILAPPEAESSSKPESEGAWTYVKEVFSYWYENRIQPPFAKAFSQARDFPWLFLAMVGVGLVWSLAWFWAATRKANGFDSETPPDSTTRSGWTPEDEFEARFVLRFNVWSVVFAVALMIGISLYIRAADLNPKQDHFLAGIFLPFAFAVGGFVTGQFIMHVVQSWMRRGAWRETGVKESRVRRSLYSSLRGACIFGSGGAVVFPVVIVFLFSLKAIPLKVFLVLLSLIGAQLLSRKGGGAALPKMGGWPLRPAANFAVLVFLAFAFAWASSWLQGLYPSIASSTWVPALLTATVCTAAFILLGVFINANRVSPHYFYRDRLTEAYLKTDARTLRKQPEERREQGMPLTNLRDDEDLKLENLGGAKKKAPYHLIVAALNLSGSRELNRRSFVSEHFVFSRDFVGSKVTGWVKTSKYRGGTTRLARAMAVSAAAVGSAMGHHTFAAQAFLATLFNTRLGYWMDNPWRYRNPAEIPRGPGVTFWPWYLLLEVFGRTSARDERVNVSDGGHTGDNLGLLPLLQRRCSVIVVCDAEADDGLTFGSFNNAVRMALIEENIEIAIDLSPVMTRSETSAGYKKSEKSVVEGTIDYPNDENDQPVPAGKLVYLKSSVSGPKVPVHVENYAKGHEKFPHQTTADQFFDDAQFEAYRALGEYLGERAAETLSSDSVSEIPHDPGGKKEDSVPHRSRGRKLPDPQPEGRYDRGGRLSYSRSLSRLVATIGLALVAWLLRGFRPSRRRMEP